MGQINSSLENENSAEHGGGVGVMVQRREEDSRGSESTPGANCQEFKNHVDSIQCVKTRIDMLIEDCLNVKDTSNDEPGCKVQNSENDTGIDTKPKCEEREQESEKTDNEASKCDENKGNDVNVTVVDVDGEGDSKNIGNDRGEKKSGSDEKRDGDNKNSAEKKDGEEAAKANDEKHSDGKLNISDLIKEIDNSEIAQRHKKTVTTFQMFIDKVLDNSLINVPVSENIPSNFLKLCQESMQPGSENSKESVKESEPETKPKFDKLCTKIKPERKITLKDHIERFLESSFRDEIDVGGKDVKQTQEKKEATGSRNGFPDNFNAQGLVNNMISQGLHINKLLSPPLLVNHSKNPQKSPDIRAYSGTEQIKPEPGIEPQKQELKSDLYNARYKSEAAGQSKNYLYHKNTSCRSGSQSAHHQQTSPGHQNAVNHTRSKQPVKDIRDSKHHSHLDYKTNEGNQNEYVYHGRPYPADFSQDHIQSGHHPGYHSQHLEHSAAITTLDQSAQPSIYSVPYPGRAAISAPYHPMVVPPQGLVDDQRGAIGRPGVHHPLHHKDCMCPMCGPHQQHSLDPRDLRDKTKMEYHAKRHSPNVPPYIVSHEQVCSHHLDTTPAMMRPSHVKYPPGAGVYPNMPKLLPQHPPITSAKEYGPQLLVPGIGVTPARRPSLPENAMQRPYIHPDRRHEYSHAEQAEEYSRRMESYGRGSALSAYPARPSSMPSHENASSQDGIPVTRRSPAVSDSGSRSSETSTETPLDLSVKKPKIAMERPRSSSYSSGAQHSFNQKKLNPSNTFLRHLENSVDKYCQEASLPDESSGAMKSMIKHDRPLSNRSPNESKQTSGYPGHGQRQSSPHNIYNIQSHGKLPSPHFTGGITMGQPLMENRSQQSTAREPQYNTPSPLTVSQPASFPQQSNSQSSLPTTQANFDMNNKRSNINAISKHEPIQNIIGSHDPNDILYLICTICTQTYGSPYGFRKHFRNQHGFEPRAEHTIVQTISATKSALHGPVVKGVVSPDFQPHQTTSPPAVKENTGALPRSISTESDTKSRSDSPYSRKSPFESGSENSDKAHNLNTGLKPQMEKVAHDEMSERKFLECPECGKTFQLNDFGSYKRHCRQHNSVKVTGPYTCSDCHLSFPDQKALKEHYIFHVTESHNLGSEMANPNETASGSKNSTSGVCYACVKCEKQFDNITAYNSHIVIHDQPPRLSPKVNVEKTKETNVSSESNSSVPSSLNVIPSHCIVKQAAESMTSQVCPDSSWDVPVKPAPATNEDKTDENTIETSDSGYSSSAGSNYMLSLEEKMNENNDKSPLGSVLRQKSRDSTSENNEEQSNDDSFFYKHKKFSQYRKRDNSFNISSDSSPSKKAKLAEIQTDGGTPVSSSTTIAVDIRCDSSETEDTKGVDKSKQDASDVADSVASSKEGMSEDKTMKDIYVGKGEARHNLPFVWDRTTRSQRKTK